MAKTKFAPLPLDALNDPRLSGADLRVLGSIAYFDRFTKNGTGCYATQETIADMTGITTPRVSSSMRTLRETGWIRSERQEDRRRFQHFVCYENTCPNEQVSPADSCPNEQVPDPKYLPKRANKEIPLNGSKDIPHKGRPADGKKYPAKAARILPKARTQLGSLRELAMTGQLTSKAFSTMGDGDIRSITAQIDRAVRRNTVTTADVDVMKVLVDSELLLDYCEIGHVQRVYEDAAVQVYGDDWEF